jgi:hypothetical protein
MAGQRDILAEAAGCDFVSFSDHPFALIGTSEQLRRFAGGVIPSFRAATAMK